jgi:hypothetical protein
MKNVKSFNVNDKLSYPKRQVHLDFHTSPCISGIAKRFSRDNFIAALKKGHVSSITVFAKCHHSYCYYPTKYGIMHPGLDFDLTGEMINAAHEAGVRAPVYITAGWSEHDAQTHPEWCARDKDGNTFENLVPENYDKSDPNAKRPETYWTHMCLNDGSYAHHIYDLTREVCERYSELDGLFYDICVSYPTCYCDECRAGMKKMGLNPENEDDAKKYLKIKHIDFMNKCGEILHSYHKNATIFFNAGGAEIHRPEFHDSQTHFEMEDLPTAWGGYNQMAPRARFFDKTNKYYMGMTGKFHLAWGEFGGFKSKDALKYEVCCMAQYGAGSSIGDHLCPDGEMDMQTYENIGHAYSYLEKIEEFCFEGEAVTNIGVYFVDKTLDFDGLVDILLENQIDFDYVRNGNFKKFDLVIFPSDTQPTSDDLKALKEYLSLGGKLLFIGNSLQKDGEFLIDCGLKKTAPADRDQDYILARISEDDRLPKSPFLSYIPIDKYENIDAEIFASAYIPMFSRTNAHYCGHKNAPYDKDAIPTPALARKGNVVYMAHKVGEMYKQFGCLAHRDYLISAIKNLCSYEPVVSVKLGSCGRVTAINQSAKSRYCINLTYAAPAKRGVAEIIDDIIPLYNIPCSIKTDKNVTRVYSPITNEELEFKNCEGRISFVIPKIECHNTVVIEYKEV